MELAPREVFHAAPCFLNLVECAKRTSVLRILQPTGCARRACAICQALPPGWSNQIKWQGIEPTRREG